VCLHPCTSDSKLTELQSNILIDDNGQALLTDFGLSNVIEEVLESEPSMRNTRFATSLFAGSTRWMAPELIEALTNDDEAQPPPISTSSDVYAFACVCLEVGLLIYLCVPVC
jgi:serine/threonine protein kinase